MSVQSLATLFEKRENNLNLIRLLAAIAVIYGHANVITGKSPPDLFLRVVGFKFIGGVAVDVFFVVSGFLITASALKSENLARFALSRFLRIYPALVVCVFVTTFVLGGLLTEDSGYYLNSSTWRYFFVNASATGTEYYLPGVFSELHDKAVNGSIWSIVLELKLYIVVFLLSLSGVLLSKNRFNALIFFVVCAGYFDAGFIHALLPVENHRHVALMFLLGAFACINRSEIPVSPVILLVLLFLAAATHQTDKFVYLYTLTLTYAALYLAVIPGGRWFNTFGDYSYGVYLYGWPSQQLVASLFPGVNNTAHTLIACGLALLFAALSWHLIEKPCLRLKGRSFERRGHGNIVEERLSR